MEQQSKFGNLIKERRKDLKLSQVDLAKAVGVTQQQVSNWEGGSIPKMNHAIALGQVLKLDIMQINNDPENIELSKTGTDGVGPLQQNGAALLLVRDQETQELIHQALEKPEIEEDEERLVAVEIPLWAAEAWDICQGNEVSREKLKKFLTKIKEAFHELDED